MLVCALREKHDEERYQPLKTFRTLIELDFDADVILDNDFKILPVGYDAQSFRFRALCIRHPSGAKFFGQANTGGGKLVRSKVELIAIRLQRLRVARRWLRNFPEIRKLTRGETE